MNKKYFALLGFGIGLLIDTVFWFKYWILFALIFTVLGAFYGRRIHNNSNN